MVSSVRARLKCFYQSYKVGGLEGDSRDTTKVLKLLRNVGQPTQRHNDMTWDYNESILSLAVRSMCYNNIATQY